MGAEAPLFTVIVPVYNSASTLQRCLDSVLQQTLTNYELIVQDGGSTDGGVAILQANQDIDQWVSEPDEGIYDAFNKGIKKARGDWIYFLGADDYLWDRHVLARMAPHLQCAYPPYRIVYAREAFVSQQGEILEYLGEPWKRFRRRFLGGMMIPHQATMHHRSLFDVHGLFNSSFRIGGDYELLLRELKDHDPLFVPDIVVAGYQFGGGSSDPENSIKVLRVVRLAQRLNGVRFPGWFWIGSVVRVYLRLALWRAIGPANAKRVLDWGRSILGKAPFWTRT